MGKNKPLPPSETLQQPDPSPEEITGASEAAESIGLIDEPEIAIPADFDPDSVNDVAKARELAKIPAHKRASDLIGRELVWLQSRPQKAVLPGTGEINEGLFCVVMDAKTREVMTVFIGQQVLQKDLRRLPMPFKGKIAKEGRSYKFV